MIEVSIVIRFQGFQDLTLPTNTEILLNVTWMHDEHMPPLGLVGTQVSHFCRGSQTRNIILSEEN